MADKTKRKIAVRNAFRELGNIATTAQIAEKTGYNINGVAQTIGVMDFIEYVSGKSGQTKWKNTKK